MGLKGRRDHARAVLLEQHQIRMLERYATRHSKVEVDPTEKLALFSASKSSRSSNTARIRAAMAA